MIVNLFLLAVSLALLVISAERFVEYAAQLAKKLGMSSLAIGLTVVAIGTSLPEAMVSVFAAMRGFSGLALGNVVGSNICNVGLILGIPACIAPITCRRSILKREGSLMLLCSVLLWVTVWIFGGFGRLFGVLLLGSFFAFVWWALKNGKDAEVEDELSSVDLGNQSTTTISLKIVGSLAVLLIASRLLVDSAEALAIAIGVSDNVIGLSIVALGTSLPELSVALAALHKQHGEMLVGNIIGSNISNILFVVGCAVVVQPFAVSSIVVNLDIPFMIFCAFLMVGVLWSPQGVTKGRALLFLGAYGVFMVRCALISS